MLNVPVGTYKRFYRNTVEIAEISENHLEAIVGGRQVADVVEFSAQGEKVVQKPQGEGKALEIVNASGGRQRRVLIT